MKQWEETLSALKKTLADHQKAVVKSATELERVLKEYDRKVELNTHELRLLRTVDVELAKSSFDFDGVIKLIVEGARTLIEAEYGDLLLPADSKNLKIVWSSKDEKLIGELIPINRSITGKAFRTGKSQNVGNINAVRKLYFKKLIGMNSELAVPMKAENKEIIGVINIESSAPKRFNDHHRELVEVLAGQAAIAFRNARLFTELKAITELQSRVLSETNSLRKILSAIGERAKELVGAEGCQILTRDEDELIIEYTTGEEPLGTRVLVNDSVTGLAVKSGKSLNIEDIRKDTKIIKLYKDVLGGMRSEFVIPLKAEGKIIGVINFESPHVGAFKGREYLIKLFADQAAMALLNATRIEELLTARQIRSELWAMARIGDTAANLIHRVNSDVGAIKSLVDEIRYREAELVRSNSFLSDRLDDIYNMAIKALEIPHSLKAKIEMAEQEEDIDVNQLIKDALSDVEKPEEIKINLDKLDHSIKKIHTAAQFEEVIKNIIVNAYDAMPEGGTLTIETKPWKIEQSRKKPELGVEIIISDTGIGIPSNKMDKIFEIGISEKKHRQGMGFGLWWVKRFLERYGGELSIESTENMGTKVSVKMLFKLKLLTI